MVKNLLKLFPVLLILLFAAAEIQAQSWLSLGPDDFNQPSFGPVTFTRIATDGSGISYVAYEDVSNGRKITVRKFDGSNWTPVGTPGFSTGEATYISLAINGNTPYVAYQDYANNNKAIVKKFDGTNWVTVGVVGISVGQAYSNTLAFDSNSSPYIAYFDTNTNNSRIAVVKKFDGNTWLTVGSSISSSFVGDITLAINGTTPYVFYSDYNSNNGIVKRFNGTSWVVVGTTGFIASNVSNLNLAFAGNTPYIAYGDVNNKFKATVKRFNGSAWELVGAAGFSADNAGFLKFATNGSTPYVIYSDIANGYKATVMKFDGSNWVALGGLSGFSADQADQPTIAFSNNTPYVIYGDDSKNGKATVKKFDGSSWITQGTSFGFTGDPAYAGFISLTSNNNQPYLAYSDGRYSAKASMSTYNGSNWVTVGAPGFSPVIVGNISSDFYANTPYVAYTDFTSYNNGKATVKKFDGTNWLTVGNPNFSTGNVFYSLLKLNKSGVPYLVYSDGANSLKATVKKFDGSSWTTVGVEGFSASQANYTSIAFDGDTPYVIYADGVYTLYNGYNGYNGGKATVKKFDGSSWVTVGTPSFSAGPVNNTTLAFDGNTLYAAYQEAFTGGNIIVKKFDGTSWVTVATPIQSSSISSPFSITLIKNELYIIYPDQNAGKATVKKLSGSSWVSVGAEAFSASTAGNPQIASSGNKIYIVYSSDGLTYVKYVNLPASNNVQLSNLTLSSGKLTPAFASDTISYKTTVDNSISTLTLNPTTSDATATITVNGIAVASGTASAAIPLKVGLNLIKTVVTAQDGVTQKEYILAVNRAKAIQTITFATLPAKTYGDADFVPSATSSSSLTPVTYSSSDPAVATILNGKIHLLKAGTAIITASKSADSSYLAATDVIQTLTVHKAALSVAADNQTKAFGAANSALTVSYNGFLNGDTPDSLTTKPTVTTTATSASVSGTYPITVTGAASANYDITYMNGSLTVGKGVQAITFAFLPAKTYGDADFTLNAVSSSGLPINYASSNPAVATINSAGIVHILSTGATDITASQTGNDTFSAATSITQNLLINKASLIITANNQTKTFGAITPNLTVAYSGFVNGDTQDNLGTKPTVTTTSTNASAAGTYSITVSGATSANYDITYINGTLTIGHGSQVITFTALTAKTYGNADFTLNAISSSGLPINYSSSNPMVATVNSAGLVHIVSSGATDITASQTGNDNFNPVASVTQNLVINKASVTVTASNQTKTYGTANPPLTAIYTGFVNGETSSVLMTQPVITTSANTTTDAGNYPITASVASAANYNFNYVSGMLAITQAKQTISFASVPAKAFGDADFDPGAVSSAGLPITYTSSNANVLAVANGKLHIAGAGNSTVTAVQAGNVNYLPTAAVSQDLQVIFTLPSNNFTVGATGESCKGSSNGEINISAVNNLSYTASITSTGISATYPFSGKLSVKNLPAGNYSVCVTIGAYPAYKQCFEVTVTTPKDLSVYSVVNPASGMLSLNLSGGSSYNIILNGASFITTKSAISLALAPGKNILSITTTNICQGVYEKTIELPVKIIAYPNPFENQLSLSLTNDHSLTAKGEVYNMQGKLVFSGKSIVSQGVCSFDLSTLLAGSYVLKLSLDQSETNIKIIKK